MTSGIARQRVLILDFGSQYAQLIARRVREQNEDSFLVDDQLQLFLVADGMGGHLGGKRASSLTVETVQRFVAERITK